MLSGADAAMYAVKRSVAGGYAVFDPPAVAVPGRVSPVTA
jgi:hypothetical protein